MKPERFGVVVVGGGQAGLALGYHLQRAGVDDFVVVDAAPEIGHVWRRRWDSLKLFTPAQYSSLPGMEFPKSPDTYPTKDEVADYVARYADEFRLPVRLGERVMRLSRRDDLYRIDSGERSYEAEAVVLATGPFQRPQIPPPSQDLDDDILQLHTSEYRNPTQIPPGDVLVVGAGDSGLQISTELARDHKVYLSRGGRRPYIPQRLLGKDIFWWLTRLGAMRIRADTARARLIRRNEPVVGSSLRALRRLGVEVVGRIRAAHDDHVTIDEGRRLLPRTVVWATGFRLDFSWVDVPVLDEEGLPVHDRGMTRAPGLYFLGLPWQHTPGSALLGWVGHDAAFIASEVCSFRGLGSAPKR